VQSVLRYIPLKAAAGQEPELPHISSSLNAEFLTAPGTDSIVSQVRL
jgi:hypothetical protein